MPKDATDPGEIDEVVVYDPALVHIEQLDENVWCVLIHESMDGDGPVWCGEFYLNPLIMTILIKTY